MATTEVQFAGSMPEAYQERLVPLIFEDYARDLAGRVSAGGDVLETACGTGVVSRYLAAQAKSLCATDFSEPMLDVARSRSPGVDFRFADACDLPFADASFDAVVNQFGVMFVPDEARCYAEAARVLRPGGMVAFNVWDSLGRNPIPACVHEAVQRLCPENPPLFLETPFTERDYNEVVSHLQAAGFAHVRIEVCPRPCRAATASDAALAFVTATPLAVECAERGIIDEALGAAADAVRDRFGDGPIETTMQATIVEGELS